jgi:hypothetical protein
LGKQREYIQSFLDFIDYPPGKGPSNITSVIPHRGKRDNRSVSSLEVYWCALNLAPVSGVYPGAPASPMNGAARSSLAELVKPLAAVLEAHIPQTNAPSVVNGVAQILVVIDRGREEAPEMEHFIKESVAWICPPDAHLDVWSIKPDHSFLDSIRRANCGKALRS